MPFLGSSAVLVAFTLCRAPPRMGSFFRAMSVSARGPPRSRTGVLSTATTRPDGTFIKILIKVFNMGNTYAPSRWLEDMKLRIQITVSWRAHWEGQGPWLWILALLLTAFVTGDKLHSAEDAMPVGLLSDQFASQRRVICFPSEMESCKNFSQESWRAVFALALGRRRSTSETGIPWWLDIWVEKKKMKTP